MHLEIKLHPLVAEFRVTKPVAFFQKSLMRPVTPSIQALQFDRKQLRLIKNRQAADLSRRKKKEEMEYLKKRVAELELKVYELETKNMTLELENSKFRGKSSAKDFGSSDIPVFSSPGTVSNDMFTDLQFNYQSSNPPSPQSDSTLDNEQKLFDSLFNFDANDSIKGVFSIFLISFASLILPSTSVNQKTISSPAPSPSALAIPEFPVAEWRPLNKVKSLPSEKMDFINTVSTISDSKILTQITSIFKGSGNCDATLGVTKDFILLGPEIRLVPYSGLDAQDLRLSLLSRVPWKAESQTHKHGVLKLDMKVIKASWTTE